MNENSDEDDSYSAAIIANPRTRFQTASCISFGTDFMGTYVEFDEAMTRKDWLRSMSSRK